MAKNILQEFDNTNAELEARKEILEINAALKRLEENEDYKKLMKFILETQVLQYKTRLAFTEPDRRMEVLEEFMWRASLEKTLDSFLDVDTVKLNTEIDELSKY